MRDQFAHLLILVPCGRYFYIKSDPCNLQGVIAMEKPITFASRGDNVTIYPYVVFINPERLYFGHNIVISEFCWLHAGRETHIGSFVHLGNHSSVTGGGVLLLEDFTTVSGGVRLVTGSEMVNGEGLTNHTIPAQFRAVSRSYVHLEQYAFLATNVVVHPGVTIGEGAVVGSNSVVTKDVEPWTVNVGAPAGAIRRRESQKIKKLAAATYKEKAVERFSADPYRLLKTTEHFLPDWAE